MAEIQQPLRAAARRKTPAKLSHTTLPRIRQGAIGRRAETLLGILPLARRIPQDVHSFIDYAAGGGVVSSALFAQGVAPKLVGLVLGMTTTTASLLTDDRLSWRKVIPIEVHEATDYLWGASAIVAPFLFGYYKRDRVAAIVHLASGIAALASALLTDYRAATGVRSSRQHYFSGAVGG